MKAEGSKRPRVVIVGGGVGGLAAAVRLLALGHPVTVLERAARPGGKLRQISVETPSGPAIFDGGPSVLTMPWVLDELFAAAGLRRADFVTLTPLAPACRHFFTDGTVLDLYNDEPTTGPPESAWARSAEEIRRVIGATAAAEYSRYRQHAAQIYRAVERPFLLTALPRTPIGLFRTHSLRDIFGLRHIDAMQTLWQSLCSHFSDERLRVLFARYATYSGADPFLAPATLSVIPHVELAFGVYAVEGGMYRLAEALGEVIARLGGEVRTGAAVSRIELDQKGQRAVAVHVGGERLAAELVVANCDVAQLYGQLLADTRLAKRAAAIKALPPSLSASLNLIVADDAAALPLCHHNVFFSADYRREFEELSAATPLPSDPTVYLCNPDYGQGRQRWFFLTNAPPLAAPSEQADPAALWDAARRATGRERVATKLAQHGIALERHARGETAVTPADFAALFPSSRGAIYGAAASSRMAAFKRPPNQVPGVENLYCVGGSTHPGAGVPMVMLSAAIVAGLIADRESRASRTSKTG